MSLTTVDGSLISSGAITLTTQVTGTLPVANGGTGVTTAIDYGFRNRIINGSMVIDQRNAGASVTPANGAYTLDRYVVGAQQASKFSVQQNAGSVTLPVGFSKYLGVTSLSSYSVLAADFFEVGQIIEGQNIYDLAWGTANAKTVTLSFQVYSSLTGSFGGNILNGAETRCYPFIYSIPVANTWTSISITIAGDTSGTWLTTNGQGMKVFFSLGAGSSYAGPANAWSGNGYHGTVGTVSVVGTNGATFYITGVQLEKGSTATSFDYRPYGTELALCQRYFELISSASGYLTPLRIDCQQCYVVQKRAAATMAIQGTTANLKVSNVVSDLTASGFGGHYGSNIDGNAFYITLTSSGTTGQAAVLYVPTASAGTVYLSASSEL